MNRLPPSPITEAEIATFERDGVVCLRGMFDSDWVERMRAALDRLLESPTPEGRLLNPEGTPGRFERDIFLWMADADFRALALESPSGAIAAACMRSARINLMADLILVKEPHTPSLTPWHHDQPYNWYDGSQACGMWLSLDTATAESGAVEWVTGSHKWGRWFEAAPFDGSDAYELSDGFDPMPDFDAARDQYRIVGFDTKPGDCIVNHLLTIHSAPGNQSDRRRRAIIYRFAGDDATYAERGPGRPKPLRDPGLKPGDPFPPDHDQFPLIWPPRADTERTASEAR